MVRSLADSLFNASLRYAQPPQILVPPVAASFGLHQHSADILAASFATASRKLQYSCPSLVAVNSPVLPC